jgi:hypothetical protein
MRNFAQWTYALAMLGASLGLPACSSQQPDPQAQMYDRQEQALKHPFDYTAGNDNPDISGGGIGDLDKKALGKDLHDFFNP